MSTTSQKIDAYIADIKDWREPALAELRAVILKADPDLTEDWKWNTPVYTKNGLVCAISAFKTHVKVNFFRGAELSDPQNIFNAGLDAKTMRSIDLKEGEKVDEADLQEMVRAAIALNG